MSLILYLFVVTSLPNYVIYTHNIYINIRVLNKSEILQTYHDIPKTIRLSDMKFVTEIISTDP